MTFEEKLRARIAASSFGSTEKNILKLVLGECQEKSGAFANEERGLSIVKKLISSNEETMGYMDESDARYQKLVEENEILTELLPSYWSADQIRAELANCDLASAKSDGQATGLAMKHLKGMKAPVEGNTVKEVVAALRAS